MSGDYDGEEMAETSAISTVVNNDDDDDEVVGANSKVTVNQELSSREANYDSNNSNEDGVLVNTDNNGSGGDSDGVVVSEDAGREDMFLDAPEDLGADGRESSAAFTEAQGSTDGDEDSGRVQQTRFHGLDNEMQNDYMVDEMERLRAMLDKTMNEKESMLREHKDEMEMAAKGVANLRDQMRDFTNKQLLLNEGQSESLSHYHGDVEQVQLHEMIHECSMFLRSVMEEVKDLNTKSSEAAISHEVVSSYLNSVRSESAEVQFQKDQYMDDVTNRILNSVASLVYVGDLSENSTTAKMAHVEKSMYALIENYNWFLYQSDQLRQCLTELRPDLAGQTDYGVIFAAANEDLVGFRNKETEFAMKLSQTEAESRELKEQLEKHKAVAETANAELERLKTELEHEKHRYSNTKEKLSLAVTKGKALVQQRDTLKQMLAEKTSELENSLSALKEKTSALEAAELIKEELVKSQIFGAELQEVMVQKDLIFEKLEDILFQSGIPEGLNAKDITEKTRWLVDERNALKDVSLKFHQLADALLSIDLPENFSFSDLESRLGWLTQSYDQAKADIGVLQDEISKTGELLNQANDRIGSLQDENVSIRETAHTEMENLTVSLSTVLVEKDCIQMALEDMSDKYEAIVQREQLVSSEKEDMLRIIIEASGVFVADSQTYGTTDLVERCLATVKERNSSSHESVQAKEEIIQNLQSLLYVKDQDLVLREKLSEEETQKVKMDMDQLNDSLRKAFEEVASLKEQNENLKKDLERTEDKSALIREKLSMAVKKGKGLVQEREGLKQLIDEKSSEIEKLKLELQQKELVVNDYESESNRLSAQVEGIAKLEADLLTLKGQRDQLEMDLVDSNKSLHDVMESVNSIGLPAHSSFEGPVEKLQWLGRYLSECETAKVKAERELESAMQELDTLASKDSETKASIKNLEDALAIAEEKISQLAQEKSEVEVAQSSLQQQLQRVMQEASLFSEADVARKALEDALALAESNVTRLDKEKEESESSKASVAAELNKARSDITDLSSELAKATTTITELEETISGMESRISVLNHESNEAQIGKAMLEAVLKKLEEEIDSQDIKLQDALSRVESLENKLSTAENDLSELRNEKMAAEQEVSTLNAKLSASLEELAGTHGSLKSRSLELSDHFKGLEQLKENDSVISSLRSSCEIKFETLREMEGLFRGIRGQLADIGVASHSVSEEPSHLTKLLATSLDDIFGLDTHTSAAEAVESDDTTVFVQKIVETVREREKTLAQKVDGLLSFLDECNASVLQELLYTSKHVTPMVQKMESLDEKMKKMEIDHQAVENKVTGLEDDVSDLLSACSEVTRQLESEVDKRMPEIYSSDTFEVKNDPKYHESKHVEAINMLFLASQKLSTVCELFENSKKSLSSTTEELQNSLTELNLAAERTIKEKDLYSNKIHELESDLETLQNVCSELRLKVEKYEDMEARLKDKDEEISSLQSNLMVTVREAGEALLVASDVRNLIERADRIQVSLGDSTANDIEPHKSTQMKKLICIIDSFPELQHQIENLSLENDKLQTALSAQCRETEHLKEQVQGIAGHEQDLANVQSKIVDVEAGLNRIIQNLASRGLTLDQRVVEAGDLVLVLEKLTMSLTLECENLRSRAQELELEVERCSHTEQESVKLKAQILDLELGVQKIIKILKTDMNWDQKPVASRDPILVLENLVTTMMSEYEELRSETRELDSEVSESNTVQELAEVRGELVDMETDLKRIIQKLRGDASVDQTPIMMRDLPLVLEKMIMGLIMESENSKSKADELDSKLLGSQKVVDELLLKVKSLEDSHQSRVVPPETIQERSIFEAPAQLPASEISEIEDVASISKATVSPVPSSTHVRMMKKGSSDHIALNIDSEASRLIESEEAIEDKGHVFKSLNTSGLVPIQGKMIADRIDGIWVSGGRLLMSQPRARLGVIVYWLFLHMWLLGTIL